MQIAVIGSWDTDLDNAVYETAEEVGRRIAGRGDVVLTGGSTGVMEAAMKGAKFAGGTTAGILPTETAGEYEMVGRYVDIRIQTGMGEMGKLAPLIQSADGVIAIAGGSGTLIEIAMAYIGRKPIVMIPFTGFTTDRIQRYMIGDKLDHRGYCTVDIAADARSAVEMLYKRLRHPVA